MSTDQFADLDDFLGGGTPSISFAGEANRNVWKGGTVVKIGQRQQSIDFVKKTPETWDDGSPKMVLPITVQTNERDPLNPADDGQRTLWVGDGTAMLSALRTVLRASQAKLRPGGVLYVRWTTGEGKVGDPKVYEVNYTPAIPGAAEADAMLSTPAAAPVAQPAPTPVATPPAAPTAPPAAPPAPAAQPAVAAPPAAPAAPGPDPMLAAAYARLAPEHRDAAIAAGLSVAQIDAFWPPAAPQAPAA